MRNLSLHLLSGLLLNFLLGCDQSEQQAHESETGRTPALSDWRRVTIPDGGDVVIEGEELILGAGNPMSGIVYTPTADNLPVTDYRLRYQACRQEGLDFFASATFPVRSLDTSVTLILGGWGGGLVGISSIDQLDASENSTRSSQRFENGQWYQIEIAVESDRIRVWIDQRPVINASIVGRDVGLRVGDIEGCAPLGFASWRTTSRIRRVEIRPLGDLL